MSKEIKFYKETRYPQSITEDELDDYLSKGWFRMKQSIFTSTHNFEYEVENFRDLWWLRFPMNEIRNHHSHKRIRKINQGFKVKISDFTEPELDMEIIYYAYLTHVTFRGYDSIQEALMGNSNKNIYNTKCIRIYDHKKIIAAGIFDLGTMSGASILHFYDPEYDSYSLGKYLILLTIDYLKAKGRTFYYPGYVVSGNPRFDYKLFLGKESAYYFDSEINDWNLFDEKLLQPIDYTYEDWDTYFGGFFKIDSA